MTTTAATRKGSGRTNQDRYIIGPNFAAVLDGASTFSDEQPERDGGWYAGRLGFALHEVLSLEPGRPIPELVERAIERIVTEHDLRPETSPTSTIALARWDDEQVEVYVLGDSTAAIIHPDGSEDVYSDDRIAAIGSDLRRAYRERLAAGSGFDDHHRQLLASLQAEQATRRNREGGYWIAGSDIEVAHYAVLRAIPRAEVAELLLASDGAASGISQYRTFSRWKDLLGRAPLDVLRAIEADEGTDPQGKRWPRAKAMDDKTLVRVDGPL